MEKDSPYHLRSCHSGAAWFKGQKEPFPCDCGLEEAIKSRDQQIALAARRKAKEETAHDFDAIVEVFNDGLRVNFDKESLQRLRLVINGADSRAKYLDLPEQVTLNQAQKEES